MGLGALVVAVFMVAGAAPATASVTRANVATLLADPASPSDDSPEALSALGAPQTPEDDLRRALADLASAGSEAEVVAARDWALAVLAGDPLPGDRQRVWEGIPLLNYNHLGRVKTVPAGGNVVINQIRADEEVLSDSYLLDFEDPSRPFSITYRVAELGGARGGVLAPALLGANATGGHEDVFDLNLGPRDTGTHQASRFTDSRGLPLEGAPEVTRAALQEVTVTMPAPGTATAILDPTDLRSSRMGLASLRPAASCAPANPFGYCAEDPTPAQRTDAIAKLSEHSPERQIYDSLAGLDPADLTGANGLGSSLVAQVGVMHERDQIPPGVGATGAADVTVVLMNNEIYMTPRAHHLPANQPLTVQVLNQDAFQHRFGATELHGRNRAFGALDWGSFEHTPMALGQSAVVEPGGSPTFTLSPTNNSFALWLGDLTSGPGASAVLELDRGPALQTVSFAPDSAAPVHDVQDRNGDIWVTLEGNDTVARLRDPGGSLSGIDCVEHVRCDEYVIPGGASDPVLGDPLIPVAPHDIEIDGRGNLWVTLGLGNAIARIDPAQVRNGTDDGFRVYPLPGCDLPQTICNPVFPPNPGGPPTRLPLQMAVTEDGQGNTVVYFTQMEADRIGVMRFAPDGRKLDEMHVPCRCVAPLGIDLDATGSVWFSEVGEALPGAPRNSKSRVVKMTLDQSRPYEAAPELVDYYIPRCEVVQDPDIRIPTCTAAPHSVEIDRDGLIWVTGEAIGSVMVLDPARALPGEFDPMSQSAPGWTEHVLPPNEFGRLVPAPADVALDRSGTAFVSDEYGDHIATLDRSGVKRNSHGDPAYIRPIERNSLTDQPMIDNGGNLWIPELASNLLTRIADVAVPSLLPGTRSSYLANPDANTVEGSNLRGATQVTVEVTRGETVVARRAGITLGSGGTFTAGSGATAWQVSAGVTDALQPGDTVSITPLGQFAPAPATYEVAALGSVAGDGTPTFTATKDGRPLFGSVALGTGTAAAEAFIDPQTGAYAGSSLPVAVSYTDATPMGSFKTTTQLKAPGPPPDRTAPRVVAKSITGKFRPRLGGRAAIRVRINEPARVVIKIRRTGRLIKSLGTTSLQAAGWTPTKRWNGRNARRGLVSPGRYQVRVVLTDPSRNSRVMNYWTRVMR